MKSNQIIKPSIKSGSVYRLHDNDDKIEEQNIEDFQSLLFSKASGRTEIINKYKINKKVS